MVFVSPQPLWLLPIAIAVAWAGTRRTASRRWALFALWAGGLTLLVLALADPYLRSAGPAEATVVCLDLGPGLPPDGVRLAADFYEQVLRRDATARGVVFSNRAEVIKSAAALSRPADEAALRDRIDRRLDAAESEKGGMALAAALRLAGAQVPPGARGTIELWSAGLATRGDAEAEALRLARRGVRVRVTNAPLRDDLPAAIVQAVSLPGSVRVGQAVTAEIGVDARVAGRRSLTLTTSDGQAIKQDVTLATGTGRLSVAMTFRVLGVVGVEAAVDGGPSRRAAVWVEPAASVVVVRDPRAGTEPGSNWAALLGDAARVTVVSPAELAEGSYEAAAAVVLDDVPAAALPPRVQERLRDRVARGMGLMLIAGPASVPEETDAGPLARMWPARLPRQGQTVEPSTTLVLILDTSGSMQGEPLDLAKEVGRLAIGHLRPTDRVGIVEFYGGRRWAYPVQPVGDGTGVNRALARLTPGGASDLFPAVEEAGFALRNVATRSKHVMILSDGFVAGGPFASRVRQMAGDGITTSAVQIGKGVEEGQLMASVALWGGGRFYSVPDRFALPDVSFKAPQTVTQSPVVRRTTAVSVGDDPLTRDDATEWPAVGSYLRLSARPAADVLLRTNDNDPLLARWRNGAGWVAALAFRPGDADTRTLANEPKFASLLATLVRGTGATADPLRVTPVVRAAGVEVAVDARTRPDTSTLTLKVHADTGEVVREVACEPVAPGRWNVLIEGLPPGTYTFDASTAVDRGRAAVAVEAALPVPGVTADRALLDRIGGYAPLAAAADIGPPAPRWHDTRPALIVAAIGLIVMNVFVRRWPEGGGRAA